MGIRSAPIDNHCIIGDDPVWSGVQDPDRIRKEERWRIEKVARNARALERAVMNLELVIEGTGIEDQLDPIKYEISMQEKADAERDMHKAMEDLAEAEAELKSIQEIKSRASQNNPVIKAVKLKIAKTREGQQ